MNDKPLIVDNETSAVAIEFYGLVYYVCQYKSPLIYQYKSPMVASILGEGQYLTSLLYESIKEELEKGD